LSSRNFVHARCPENISRALDGGALGIIAPHVGSAEEARAIVKAAKFPPLGERGAAGALPQLQYHSLPAAQANAAINAATMVIVQFESAEAVDKADEIAAVEGVDMVLIGLNDMLASLGLAGEYEHPKVRDAYARTITACRKHGKHVGVGGLSARPKLAAEFIDMGARRCQPAPIFNSSLPPLPKRRGKRTKYRSDAGLASILTLPLHCRT
jgi:4-hydroxy-2-oxoheptanedioate aldolase